MTVRLPIVLSLAALAFAFPASADALGANVVPNPGFEQGACGASTPVVCGWEGYGIGQGGSPGNHVLVMGCPGTGCYGGPDAVINLSARTDPAFCAAIGPGVHAASFFATTSVGGVNEGSVSLSASFFGAPDCTGLVGDDSLGADASDPGVVSGVLVAPPGTQSALFTVEASMTADCTDYCAFDASFDDVDVDDAALPIPVISSFVAAGGPVGATVDIHGTNFDGATSVAFGGAAASFTVDSASEIHATVPSGATSGPITVTTPDGTATSVLPFTVAPSLAPAISWYTPGFARVGTSIDIRGWSLTGATSVTFTNGSGGFTPANFTVDSDSDIHATVPPGATTGPITITTPNGTTTGPDFLVNDSPMISSFAPTSGPPGTSVTITGTNLARVLEVQFGATAASFTVDSDTEIHATVPAAATTGPITVWTLSTMATSAASFTVISDTTPPDTTITSGPPATTTSSSATFQFAASEPSTFECSLDGAAFAACSSPATYTGLAPGSHTFGVRATDTAGNTDPTPAQQNWTVHTNTPPTARFTFNCSGLTCHFDATGSSDADGTIAGYAWDFGDGTSAGGGTVDHAYARVAGYAATLRVTDNDGAAATQSMMVTPITLSARGYRVKTLERVDLSWTGPGGASFNVYRNGATIATVRATAYTDSLNKKGSGSYTYKVCAPAFSSCSEPVAVSFSAGATVSRATRPARDRRAHGRGGHHTPVWTTHRRKGRS
jgi:hypothetical protein